MTITLDVTKRDSTTTPNTVPGVVYGPKQEPVSLAIDARMFEKTLHEAGESTIIVLKGLGEDIEVLIHDVAFNPTKGGVQHVDFYAIERGKELTTNVALEFTGQAPAEKSGSTVNRILHDVEVTCRPSDLPAHITVDLSVLTDDEAIIRIEDLILPAGVKVENDLEEVVANVSGARAEEPETTEAVDMSAVEVEAKGKEKEAEQNED